VSPMVRIYAIIASAWAATCCGLLLAHAIDYSLGRGADPIAIAATLGIVTVGWLGVALRLWIVNRRGRTRP
jgi:hypothetical protein